MQIRNIPGFAPIHIYPDTVPFPALSVLSLSRATKSFAICPALNCADCFLYHFQEDSDDACDDAMPRLWEYLDATSTLYRRHL